MLLRIVRLLPAWAQLSSLAAIDGRGLDSGAPMLLIETLLRPRVAGRECLLSSRSDSRAQARTAITRVGAVATNKRPVFRLSMRQSFST
jgi:hypothetical protein